MKVGHVEIELNKNSGEYNLSPSSNWREKEGIVGGGSKSSPPKRLKRSFTENPKLFWYKYMPYKLRIIMGTISLIVGFYIEDVNIKCQWLSIETKTQ